MVMLKTNTQTITLDGSEQEVRFNRNYPYFWVQNQGDSDVLISINSGIAEGKDGVMTILGGGGTGCTMHGYDLDRFYLLGSGKVQVVGTYSANCPFKAAQGGGDKYTLPVATTDILGGVKVDGTTIISDENGVISTVGGGSSGNGIFGGDLLFEADGIPSILAKANYNMNANLLDYDYIYITAIGQGSASTYTVISGILPKKALVENNGNHYIHINFDSGNNNNRYIGGFTFILSGTDVDSNNGNPVIKIQDYVSFLSIRGFKL